MAERDLDTPREQPPMPPLDGNDMMMAWRLTRLERDVADTLQEMRGLARSFSEFQLKLPDTYVVRREFNEATNSIRAAHLEDIKRVERVHDEDMKVLRRSLDSLYTRYTGLLVTGLLAVGGLALNLIVSIIQGHPTIP